MATEGGWSELVDLVSDDCAAAVCHSLTAINGPMLSLSLTMSNSFKVWPFVLQSLELFLY